jgi:hypothetical protein
VADVTIPLAEHQATVSASLAMTSIAARSPERITPSIQVALCAPVLLVVVDGLAGLGAESLDKGVENRLTALDQSIGAVNAELMSARRSPGDRQALDAVDELRQQPRGFRRRDDVGDFTS